MDATALQCWLMKVVSDTVLWKFGKPPPEFGVPDGFGTSYGGDTIFATPGIAEKGYLDARIAVSTPGGHSSVPPSHTVRSL